MALTKTAPPSADAPLFWRDAALPFIEARSIADGRKVCYCAHAHEQFSIGCITAGVSTYVSEQTQRQVGAGTVVLMNPGVVHACNPIDDQPWSYRMLYVDTPWLTRLQRELGVSPELQFQPFEETSSDDPQLFADLEQLYHALVDPQAETLHKHSCVVAFFSELQQRLNPAKTPPRENNHKLERAAQFIRQHCTEPLDLEQICQAVEFGLQQRAMQQGLGQVLLHHALRYPQLIGDGLVGPAVQLSEDEGRAHLGRQAAEHGVHFVQGLDNDCLLLRRGLHRLRACSQRLQPGLLQLPAPPVVDAQAPGHGGQVGTLVDLVKQHRRALEHPDKDVVGQVGGVPGVIQAPAQQLVEPAVMGVVKAVDRVRAGERRGGQGGVSAGVLVVNGN